MAMGLTRDIGTNPIPWWQGTDDDISLVQGGFGLVITGFATGLVLPGGTPFSYDEAARTATPVKTAILYANATNVATVYQLKKGHAFIVGDFLATGAAGGAAYAITAIDVSNALYDAVTVGTTLGVAATAGDLFYKSTATGATASAYPVISGLLYDDTIVAAGESVTIVWRATVYARRVPYNATIAAALPGIKFSQSK